MNDSENKPQRPPRMVHCLCLVPSTGSVRDGRHVRTRVHSLGCPVSLEQGTTEEELDDGPAYDE